MVQDSHDVFTTDTFRTEVNVGQACVLFSCQKATSLCVFAGGLKER